MRIHLDMLGGIAGDMFLAAAIDARPDLRDPVEAAMRAVGLPADWGFRAEPALSAGIASTRVSIDEPTHSHDHSHDHGHGRHHTHDHAGAWGDIRARIEGAKLDPTVRDHALAIFTLLAEVEAKIHGVTVDDVHFHELAGWDSVADIVGAAQVITLLNATDWSVSVLPLGGGRVRTAHGPMPVPAPATARLLEGFRMVDDGFSGERITPTGAAILRHLNPSQDAMVTGTLATQGYGAGHKDFPGLANVLRLVMFEDGESSTRDQVGVIEFEVDDQSPEDLAVGLRHIRTSAGVLDVIQFSVFAKKGRMAAAVRVLCRPDALETIIKVCFQQTTTIGLRHRIDQRRLLLREESERDGVHIKSVERPNGAITRKAALDDIAAATDDQATRATLRRHLEADDGT